MRVVDIELIVRNPCQGDHRLELALYRFRGRHITNDQTHQVDIIKHENIKN